MDLAELDFNKLKECLFYEKKDNNIVQCNLCPKQCQISEEQIGYCRCRYNHQGKLYSLTYGKPLSLSLDPIEKKPLYHFHPGEMILSLGTIGCNLSCKFCQNYDISQENPTEYNDMLKTIPPEEVIEKCKENNIRLIAFTYTEPTIFYEYMLDIAKLAKENKIKCVIVSNGFINKEPLKRLCKYISAANIDLKSFDDEFYKNICKGKLNPVLKSIKLLKENNIHVELTNLVIEKYNTDEKQIENMAKWIKDNIGENTALHLSKASPMYLMQDIEQTKIETLETAKKICEKYLKFVFIGNVSKENNTYCPECNSLMIKRKDYKTEIIKKECCNFKID